MENNTLIFVPGGPWISGEYWDHFIKAEAIRNKVKRHVIINHELYYNRASAPLLDDAVKNLVSEINTVRGKLVLVGHSYGAWLCLLAHRLIQKPNIRLILANMPSSLEKNEAFLRKLETLQVSGFSNNQEFSEYYKMIFPLYFHDFNIAKNNMGLCSNIFMESNENLLMDQKNLDLCKNYMGSISNQVELVYCDQDLIVGNDHFPSDINKHVIENCGHFPMIEKPKLFSNLLFSLL